MAVLSNYEYVNKYAGSFASDIPEIADRLMGNLLDFTAVFESGRWTHEQLKVIEYELKATARYFGAEQGLNPSGRLLTSFETNIRGNSVDFENYAKNDRGQFYAGHIEYGHYARDGKTFVEARPFMRPALYAVSRASQGNMRDILAELLMGTFLNNGLGYQGVRNLTFGHKLGADYRSSALSSSVVKGMLGSKIGKEGYSLQDKFINRTGTQFSPRRGRKGVRNSKLLEDSFFDSNGRNINALRERQIGQGTKINVKRNLTWAEKKPYKDRTKRRLQRKTITRRRKEDSLKQKKESRKRENKKTGRSKSIRKGKSKTKEPSIQEQMERKANKARQNQIQNKNKPKVNKVKNNSKPSKKSPEKEVSKPKKDEKVTAMIANNKEVAAMGIGRKHTISQSRLKKDYESINGIYYPKTSSSSESNNALDTSFSNNRRKNQLEDAYGKG